MGKHIIKNPKTIDNVKVVNDIHDAVKCVRNGEMVARFEWGTSMEPVLEHGEYGIITPIDVKDVNVGDAVLCEVNGFLMTHMVIIKSDSHKDTPQFLIGSTKFELYGWTDKIYGIVKGTKIFESED